MNKIKKILACIALSALCLTTIITPSTASAATTTEPGQSTSNAVLTADATFFSVTVPTSVLIYVDAAGNVITPDTVAIVNNSVGPIVVTSLEVTTEGGWTLDRANTDYNNFKVGRKNFNMSINGQDPSVGALSFATPVNGSDSLNLALSADVAPQKEAINAVKIGEMIVTVDWHTDESAPGGGTGGSYPEGYVMATDSDFAGDSDGSFQYIGTADYVVIPHVINGVTLTSYDNMFVGTAVKGVISDNPAITNMTMMFMGATSPTLELNLDTSSVTGMGMIAMFNNADATTLDLTSFNISNVTYLNNTFRGSKATMIDLSTWDTSNVESMQYTFRDSAATTVLVRTQADADKLSESDYTPAGLNFVVK